MSLVVLVVSFLQIIFNNPLIRTRRKEFKFSNDDLTEIYNSRTFCLYEDIDNIKRMGLAKGGAIDIKELETVLSGRTANQVRAILSSILPEYKPDLSSNEPVYLRVKAEA